MLTRRGLTLVELMVSIVLLAIVGLATARVLRSMTATGSAQMAVAANQSVIRTGVMLLPQEFREIGYDTIPLTGGSTSDLEAIAASRITFRAMRGLGITCGTPSLNEFRILKPIIGARPPLPTDGFRLFVENERGTGQDDQWVPLAVVAIDDHSVCGAQPAIAFRLEDGPEVAPGVAMALSQHFVGGPIRWYERVEYGPYVDPESGLAYLGVRSLSRGESSLSPVVGPLADTTSFELEYYGAEGAALDPALTNPLAVRAIGVSITGVTSGPVSLAGTAAKEQIPVTFWTRVALRNALRP